MQPIRPARSLWFLRCLALGTAVGACAPTVSHGYAIPIHTELSRRSLTKSGLNAAAAPVSPTAFATVRTGIDAFARSEPSLKDAWLKRYPTAESFDAFAQKQFLQLSASSQVYGLDRIDDRLPAGATLLDVLALGAAEPDDDWRNRERLAYNDKRQPLSDKYGQPVPADPALLNMGRLGALSSQAHAHYGLAQVEFSGDADVLKNEPRRFARKPGWEDGPIITLAAEMAQIHLDLSLIAALTDMPSSKELSWQYAGQGFHYLEDIGNQIHTVQVGLFDFFFDAAMERLKMGLWSGGGYLGPMRSLGSIGIDILSSHHTLSEEYTFRRFQAALDGKGDEQAQKLVTAMTEDDPEFAKLLDEALAKLGPHPERGEFGMAITRALIDVSSHEGDDVYRATAAIADPRLRTRHTTFNEERDDPEKFVVSKTDKNKAAYDEFFALQARAFRRVGTALRRWVSLEQKAIADASTLEQKDALRKEVYKRLIERQLKMQADSEARLQQYLAKPPQNITAPEHAPELLVADVVAVGLVAGVPMLIRRRRRRKASSAKT
ncbi:MAG: hypothetical protein JNM40_02205 [Myxococcales bacterium]|nr:hypothetical protein [Myxococcales bacterium]